MKKLSKIKLHNAVELENNEMKMISGGSGANDVCGQGNYNTVCECNDNSAVWCNKREGVDIHPLCYKLKY